MGAAPGLRAYEALVSASVGSQTYQLRDAGDHALTVSRLDTYLRLYVLDLLPRSKRLRRPGDRRPTRMRFVASMRLRADLGDFTRRWNPGLTAHGAEGGANPVFELLYAYLDVSDVAGWVDLRLGRQVHLDPLDFYSFDGLWARIRTPVYLAIEVAGGLRQSGFYGTGYADAPLFLMQGMDNTETRPGWLPMVSAALEATGLSFLTARLAYRVVWHVIDAAHPGSIYPEASGAGVPASQVAEERLTAWLSARFWRQRLEAYGGVRYSVLTARLADAQVGIAGRLGRSRVRAEYVQQTPDFYGDSIFNLFNTRPYREARLWYEHHFAARWGGYLRASVRLFEGGEPAAPEETEQERIAPDVGGGLGATYGGRRHAARLDLYWQEGYGGRTLGLFAFYRVTVVPDWLSLSGRGVVAYWKDPLSPTPEGLSGGLALGATLQLTRLFSLHTLVEDNFGAGRASDLRVYVLASFAWCTSHTCRAGEVIP